MARFLSEEAWMATKPPFTYLRLNGITKDDGAVYPEMMKKWIIANCSGWVYVDGSTYVFENRSDMMLFSVWIKSDPFVEEYGDVK